jgi:SulP family sulfate permease
MLDVSTIGSRFGDLPGTLPMPALPAITWDQVKAVLPSAFTIAFLAGIESLLSAVIADGMTGRRHRSNAELVAQGVANFGSMLFGGMPATGAIARTATNVRAGGQSPVAGMMHAAFLLLFMYLLGPLIAHIPLASLAAVLVIVAWNMSEIDHIRHFMRAPMGDRLVLILTFVLTVLVDLTVAIAVGVVLAALMFMHRMATVTGVQHMGGGDELDDPESETTRRRASLPAGVELFELRGPLFFGVAEHLIDVLQRTGPRPHAYVLNLREVPLVDATGANTLRDFAERCSRHRIAVYLAGLSPSVTATLMEMHTLPHANATVAGSLDEAIELARAAVVRS